MALPEYVMVVEIELDPAVVDDWNEWYDTVHLEEITACPGFERATRYTAPEPDEAGRLHHLTIYELSRGDALETPEFAAARGLGPFADDATPRTRLYRRHLVYEGSNG